MPVRVRLRARVRRFRRLVGWIGGLWLVLLGVGLLSLRWYLASKGGQRWARFFLLQAVQEALETDVSLRGLRVAGLTSISLEGLTLYDKQCQPFVQVERLEVGWLPGLFWQGYWRGRRVIPISYLELEGPRVYFYTERQSGLTNLDRLWASDETETDTTRSTWRLRLPRLSLVGGTFIWCDSTASDLDPKPGYLNYANLHLCDINLEAGIDVGSDLVFAYILTLQARDTLAGVRLDSLSLVLRAYPDSTLVDTIGLRAGATRLRGWAKFHQEGLGRLFADTDTKQFSTRLQGQLDWGDIARYSGGALPLAGTWPVSLVAEGDLSRIRWRWLRVELRPGHYLVTRGQIWHYAKPHLMHWDVRVDTAQLTLSDLSRAITEIGDWPEGMAVDSLWCFSGRVVGCLYSYWVEWVSKGLRAHYAMEKVGESWHWQADAQFADWSSVSLWPAWPLHHLSGQVALRASGFDWPHIRADLQARLSGQWDTLLFSQVGLVWHQERDTATVQLACQSLPADLVLQARMTLSPPYFGYAQASIARLAANLWGGAGMLTTRQLIGTWQGVAVDDLGGQVRVRNLDWVLPDTLIRLGDVRLQVGGAKKTTFALKSEGFSLDLVTDVSWRALTQAIQSVYAAIAGWIVEAQEPTLAEPMGFDSLEARLMLKNWAWLQVVGLPRSWQGGEASLHSTWTETGWHLAFSVDSVVFPQGDLHGVRLIAQGQWFPQDGLMLDLSVDYGEEYFLFRKLHFHHEGGWRGGEIRLSSRVGTLEDSVVLAGSWAWLGDTFPLVVAVRPEASGLFLAGESWRFTDSPSFRYQEGHWDLALQAQSARGALMAKGNPERLSVRAQGLPLGPLLRALGQSAPVEGVISATYLREAETELVLTVDSVRYEETALPTFWLRTDWVTDTLWLRLGLVSGLDTLLLGRGSYVLGDSIAPLELNLSTRRRLLAEWLSPFVGDYLQNLQGAIRIPRLAIRGKLESPKFKGRILLDQVSFYVPYLRLSYRIDNVVEWDGDTLRFREVVVQDPYQKELVVNGFVALQGWRAPFLDLNIRVQRSPFTLLATRGATDTYLYGQALVDYSDLELVGPWYRPIIKGTLRLAEGTELTLPVETYLRSQQRSYVSYVGPEAPSKPVLTAPSGVDIQVNFRSVSGVRFRVLFDSRTGDEIVAQGTASIYLEITADGQLGIAGSYEVNAGEYRFNLQGIAAKKLSLEPGSRITWDGDLFDGKLQMTAIYRTYTSLRFIDTSYTATLPVEVRVLLQGTLTAPQMSFQIDIPNLAGNPSPLIVLFTQRLQNDENERNRQVFALLTLGTFLPSEQSVTAGTNSGSANVTSTLSEFLSAQLSSLIGQAVGGQLGLSFGMGQWNDLSARLQLRLGSRLTIEREGVVLAPGQTAPTLGNLNVRYRLLPRQPTSPTQLQLEGEAFNRQTFFGGQLGATSQGVGLRLRKSFYPPVRRRRQDEATSP